VAYGLKIRKRPASEIQERVAKALDLVGLAELAKRSPGRLSGGQQQRVALARCLVVEPQVLLLDEPLSNLDALLREQMRVEIRKIQKKLGITAIYVTHDRIEAMSLSDRVIVMKQGLIRQIGSPSEIYEKPNSVFVAGFVGKVAFFPVTLETVEADGSCLCSLAGRKVKAGHKAEGVEAGSKAVITVQTASARTGDATQEGSLQGAEWFDPEQYPTARFETTGFRALGGDRYEARGTLRIKDARLSVVLPFTFREADGVATVAGRLQLDRTALNLGLESDPTGDWVSKMIEVQVRVSARRAD